MAQKESLSRSGVGLIHVPSNSNRSGVHTVHGVPFEFLQAEASVINLTEGAQKI